jgi:hypothetical protein
MAGYTIEGKIDGAAAGTKVSLATGGKTVELATDSEGRFRTVVDIFGKGGAERLAQRYGFPLLGQVPLNPVVRVGGDGGDPVTISDPNSLLATRFSEIAGKMAARLAVKSMQALPILA